MSFRVVAAVLVSGRLLVLVRVVVLVLDWVWLRAT